MFCKIRCKDSILYKRTQREARSPKEQANPQLGPSKGKKTNKSPQRNKKRNQIHDQARELVDEFRTSKKEDTTGTRTKDTEAK